MKRDDGRHRRKAPHTREPCKTCGKDDVAHYGGEAHASHVKSKRHQAALAALRAAPAPPPPDAEAGS